MNRSDCARVLLVLAFCLGLAGCSGFLDGSGDGEEDVNITRARSQVAAYNYDAAIALLEKAIEANPQQVKAHWELGLIYYQYVTNYPAAIYHFEKVLAINPKWQHAASARSFIDVSTTELAKKAPPGPQSPRVQAIIDDLSGKVLNLNKEIARLKEQLQAQQTLVQQLTVERSQLWQQIRTLQAAAQASAQAAAQATAQANAQAAALAAAQAAAQRAAAQPRPAAPAPAPSGTSNLVQRPASPSGLANTGGTSVLPSRQAPTATVGVPRAQAPAPQVLRAQIPPPAKAKTHLVRPGDTFVSIAGRYGVGLRDLQAANPAIEPRRLKAGQTLKLP